MNASSATVPRKGFLQEPTFDVVVFGEGPNEQRFSFDEFRALSLPKRVRLMLSQQPHFFLGEREIPRVEAMRYQG